MLSVGRGRIYLYILQEISEIALRVIQSSLLKKMMFFVTVVESAALQEAWGLLGCQCWVFQCSEEQTLGVFSLTPQSNCLCSNGQRKQPGVFCLGVVVYLATFK